MEYFSEQVMLAGAYTNQNETGLYVFNHKADNSFLLINTLQIPNASFLAIRDNYIYAVNENGNMADTITSLSWQNNKLTVLGISEAGGSAPCYITAGLSHVFAANYNDGTLTALPINADGTLAATGQVLKHQGNGPDIDRQESAHAHCVYLSPDARFLLAADLGIDKILVYSYNATDTATPLSTIPFYEATVTPGAGPRHLIFSNDGEYVYLVGELNATVIVFKWHNGTLNQIQEIKMMPDDFDGQNSAADIHLSANGRFLYTSNRGTANQIIIYAVNQGTGMLTLIGRQATLGIGPRNFTIDPSGKHLIVAHQYSNDIRVFDIDANTGLLTDTGHTIEIPSVVFVTFAPLQ